MALHKDLTGTDLHEPKGAAAAAANYLYVANGAGSGTWKKIAIDSVDLTSIDSPNAFRLTSILADVSTASFILIPIPFNATFDSARLVLHGAITTADSVVTFTRNDGSSLLLDRLKVQDSISPRRSTRPSPVPVISRSLQMVPPRRLNLCMSPSL